MHSRAAGSADDDERQAIAGGALDEAGQFFANDGTHAASQKSEVHNAQGDGQAFEATGTGLDGVGQAGFLLIVSQAIAIGLAIAKFERILGSQAGVRGAPSSLVRELLNAIAAGNPGVVVAFRANQMVVPQVFGIAENATINAFRPQPLSDFSFLALLANRF